MERSTASINALLRKLVRYADSNSAPEVVCCLLAPLTKYTNRSKAFSAYSFANVQVFEGVQSKLWTTLYYSYFYLIRLLIWKWLSVGKATSNLPDCWYKKCLSVGKATSVLSDRWYKKCLSVGKTTSDLPNCWYKNHISVGKSTSVLPDCWYKNRISVGKLFDFIWLLK